MKNPLRLRRFHCLLLLLTLTSGWATVLQGQVQLYQSTRVTGSIQELDPLTGNILATNIGGVTDVRGMDFSPLGGLYYCRNNQVESLANAASTPVFVAGFGSEVPHDVCFDSLGNMYVVTNLQVYRYNPTGTLLNSFAHGLTTCTGDGNGNKGWGIEVRPDNGQIYVVGREGLRFFNPFNGILLGSIPQASPFGFPCIKFTDSGFGNAYIYIGNVISGQDQVRVFDNSLNLLRTFWPTHNGNPIDFEIHPTTLDFYLFNTVTSNPTNRYSSTEILQPGWATFGNASRGSALGDFNGVVLDASALQVRLQDLGQQVRLVWQALPEGGVEHYLIERIGERGVEELGLVEGGASGELDWWDADPQPGHSKYRVRGVDANAATVGEGYVILERAASPGLEWTVEAGGDILVRSLDPSIAEIQVELGDLQGRVLCRRKGADAVGIAVPRPSQMILLRARGISETGEILAREVWKIRMETH